MQWHNQWGNAINIVEKRNYFRGFKCEVLTSNEKIHFKVQVGNARFMTIKMSCNDYSDYYLLGNAYLYN